MTIRQYLLAAAIMPAFIAVQPAAALDDAEKAEIGAFIREYLIENPDVLIEAQQALEAQRTAARQEQAGAAIAASSEQIFSSPNDIALGNPDGDVTVVEFFDYNCGYCRRAHADMKAIVESDPNVRFVLKEFPILGPDSLEAHRVSMALREVAPEQYPQFHDALMSTERADGETAMSIATDLGIDAQTLNEAMQAPVIEEDIRRTYQLADALGISGTPSYVIADEAVFGAIGAEGLMEKIENVRRCDSTTC